jgi:hypothetical protein
LLKARVTLALAAVIAVAVPTLAVAASSGGSQGTAPAATAVAAAPVCTGGLSATNGALQTRVLTTNTPQFFTGTGYVNLGCGAFGVTVPRGRAGLIVVKVDAEVTCTGSGPAVDSQWCLGRVLIGGVEGQPSAPEPDSFAWAQSSPDSAAWESAAFTRTRIVRCPSTNPATVCSYTVAAQVRNHAAGLSFRVDDLTVHAQVTYQ